MSEDSKSISTASAELIPVNSTNLNKDLLKQESTALLAKLTQETNIEKTQDLTYLFNINHSKKAMLRQETLDDTMDYVVSEINNRVKNNPDEFDTETLLKTATTVQTIMEKNAMQTTVQEDRPLIQLNRTDVNINASAETGDPILKGLSASERKHVSTFMSTLFGTRVLDEKDTEDSNGDNNE